MGHHVRYLIERRVILHTIIGPLFTDELRSANTETVTLIRDGNAPIHYIVDVREMGQIHINLAALTATVTMLREPKIGWVILIGGNALARFLATVLTQLDNSKFRMVDHPDEALQLLRRMDTSLSLSLSVLEDKLA